MAYRAPLWHAWEGGGDGEEVVREEEGVGETAEKKVWGVVQAWHGGIIEPFRTHMVGRGYPGDMGVGGGGGGDSLAKKNEKPSKHLRKCWSALWKAPLW